ncbi:MAG TPA: hypothetical protein VFQ65_19200 [Kofleriaceae bacterium]|nr:hypothetical protein [Kofleriaceae bacterium]
MLVALVTGGVAIGAELTSPAPIASAPPRIGSIGPCDPRAEQLTGEAQQAARLGQCGAVKSFGERVREIDPGCYAVEFVAIRCGAQ